MEIPVIVKSIVPKACLKRKGDLATAKNDGQLDTVSVGADGTVLTADSSQATGFNWVSIESASGSIKWGNITGILTNQNDLENALNGKEPADTNIQAHITATGNPHGTTKAEMGLGNVTNDAQVKKAPASIDSNLVAWSGTTGDTVADSGKKISDLALVTHNHNGVYEPANANIQSHLMSTTNPHNVTAGQVLPDQTGVNGKFLTSNGTTVSWGDLPAGTPPTGNGFRHVTNNTEDPAARLVADADVAPAAAIAESKLSLNFSTHSSLNDPADGEKAALDGTSGTPGASNKYVTDTDPRNTNARPPTAHDSSAHTGTIGTPSQVGLGNVPNVDATNPYNVTQDPTHRFATDTEKATWNSKQDALGFTAVPNSRQVAGHPLSADVTVSKSDVGLANVTNDAQLKVAAGDFASFPEKTSLANADLILIEDSTASGAKKKVQVGNLPGGSSLPSQSGHSGQFLTTDGTCVNWGSPSVDSAAWNAIVSKPEVTVGDSGCGASIQDALTAIGVQEKNIVVPPGNYAGPATVPSNVTLRFARGALLTSGTLTINGELQAGNHNILNGGTLVIGSSCRNSCLNPRWWGAKGDDDGTGQTGSTDDYAAFNGMITAIGSVKTTVRISPGNYKISADLSFPANIKVIMEQGAVFVPLTSPVTGTFSSTFLAGSGNLTVNTDYTGLANSPYLAIANSLLYPGSYIKTNAGNVYQVYFECYGTFLTTLPVTEAPGPWKYSQAQLSSSVDHTSGADKLDAGDVLYYNGKPIAVSAVANSTTVLTMDYLWDEFTDATFTRAVRIKIFGPLQAGRHQICHNQGVLRLSSWTTPLAYPEWWGASANRSFAIPAMNVTALHRAQLSFMIQNASYQFMCGVVSLAQGMYPVDSTVLLYGPNIQGNGPHDSQICLISAASTPGVLRNAPNAPSQSTTQYGTTYGNGIWGKRFKDFGIDCGALSTPSKIGHAAIIWAHTGGYSDFDNLYIYNTTFWALFFAGGNSVNCRNWELFACANGLHFSDNEGTAAHIWGTMGKQMVQNPQLNSATGWTVGAGWAIAGGVATHTSGGGTASLKQSIWDVWGRALYPKHQGIIEITITGWTTGALNVNSLGSSAGGLFTPANGTYYFPMNWDQAAGDCWGNPFFIELIPSNTFNGSIDSAYFYYGTGITSKNMRIDQCQFWADGAEGSAASAGVGVYTNSFFPVTNCVFNPTAIGIWFGQGGGIARNNRGGSIASFAFQDGGGTGNNVIAQGHYGTGRFGWWILSSSHGFVGDISNNFFSPTVATYYTGASGGPSSPLNIHDNDGIDRNVTTFPTISGATPSVLAGKRFKINNGSTATTMMNLLGGPVGKEVYLFFADAVTTINFTTGNFKGHSGTNWTPAVGDSLRAVRGDDGNWYCECFDNTP